MGSSNESIEKSVKLNCSKYYFIVVCSFRKLLLTIVRVTKSSIKKSSKFPIANTSFYDCILNWLIEAKPLSEDLEKGSFTSWRFYDPNCCCSLTLSHKSQTCKNLLNSCCIFESISMITPAASLISFFVKKILSEATTKGVL